MWLVGARPVCGKMPIRSKMEIWPAKKMKNREEANEAVFKRLERTSVLN